MEPVVTHQTSVKAQVSVVCDKLVGVLLVKEPKVPLLVVWPMGQITRTVDL